ncbi:MAG: SDR family oxidoreductase [Ardenticatenaceae bacterium]|nr:SDR family oxidoreductase [Ardenticatenaceae bacterium]MCB8980558.1 SDR family oxidoreductase [Ardenticatenaceae bacterium]
MILVVGATGLLGGMITQQLLQQGNSVRILVRHNSPATEMAKQGLGTPAQTLIDAGAQPVYGDLKDRASLDAACAGIETVITTANSILRGGEDTIESVDLQGTQNLIDAAKTAGVRHLIYTSADGVDINHPNPFYQAKAACEAHLAASGLDYTILKPGVFMEVWIGAVVGIPLQAGQPVTLVGKGNHQHAFVSVGDVAKYAVTAVSHAAARNKAIRIAGPVSYTWTEIVETTGQVLGQSLPINYMPMGETVPLIPEMMSSMLSGFETYESGIDMNETASIYGIQPTPLAVFAERFFKG